MHKKLASDLTSLAHSILRIKNKEDVFELKQIAYEVYEKLSVLAYVEEYMNDTPNPTKTKEELIKAVLLADEKKEAEKNANKLVEEELRAKINETQKEEPVVLEVDEAKVVEEKKAEEVVENTEKEDERETHHLEDDMHEAIEQEAEEIADNVIEAIQEETIVNEVIEQPFDELENLIHGDSNMKNDVKDVGERKTPTLEEELNDTISVDIMTDLFTKAEPKKTVNDNFQKSIQIDLNDRIAFVKHLFNGDQNDFNRVVSQLNTTKTEKEAKKFITKMVKPDYDWSDKEEYEDRLIEIIERRFA